MFPALGFGGRLPNGVVSHEFYLVMIYLKIIVESKKLNY